MLFLVLGCTVGLTRAAVPQSTVRTTDPGGITTYVGHYMNATLGYYMGANEIIDNTRSAFFSDVTDSGLVPGRVTYAGLGGILTDDADLTFVGETLSATIVDADEFFLGSVNKTDIFAYPYSSESYIIKYDGTTIRAINGTTGIVDYSGTNITEVLHQAVTAQPNALISISNIEMPPFTIGTSNSSAIGVGYGTLYPMQRKVFYANDLFWAFYSNGTNLVYTTSRTGVVWSTVTNVRTCLQGYEFSVTFDGLYIHYVFASTTSDVLYRSGKTNYDGSITWNGAEETVFDHIDNYTQIPSITVDTNGYAWIIFRDYDAGLVKYCPYVTKSQYNNGTWGTSDVSIYPTRLTTGSPIAGIQNCRPYITSLENGKVFAI